MSSSIEREAATQTQTLCSDAGFIFYLWVHSKPEKKLKIGKKTETQKNSKPEKKTRKETLKKPWKKLIYKTRRVPELNPKPDGFGCQISPVGLSSSDKFNPTTFFSQWYLTQWSRGGLYGGHWRDDLVIKRRWHPFPRSAPLDIQNSSDFTVATGNDCLSLLCSSVAYGCSLLQAHHFYWR
jgi:hypothetical protein